MLDEIARKTIGITSLIYDHSHQLHASLGVTSEHGRRKLIENTSLRQAENLLQQRFIDTRRLVRAVRRLGKRKHLLQQRLRVAHAAVGFPRKQNQRPFGYIESFAFGDGDQAVDDFAQTNSAEVVTLAA